MGKAKIIGIGIGIVLAFFIIIIAAGASNNTKPSLPSQDIQTGKDISQITSVQTQTPQTVRVNDLTFKITNATQSTRVITVVVNVENHGQRIETLSWLDFRLIDGSKNLYEDARPFPPDKGPLPAMAEVAPSGNKDFKYVFLVPEGVHKADCQLVILEDSNNLKYLDLV